MSVVKGFTELMHGTLSVQSAPGEGSTFIVEVPLQAASEEQKEKLLHAMQSKEEDYPSQFTGKKVLLVEDNALNAEIAIELLQSIGLQVDWADNGKIGVDKFEQSKLYEYFAVFMDMQMPVMDGLEATRTIRGSSREDSHVPIFAMTANTFANDRRKCREAGMDGYIAKPINIKDIAHDAEQRGECTRSPRGRSARWKRRIKKGRLFHSYLQKKSSFLYDRKCTDFPEALRKMDFGDNITGTKSWDHEFLWFIS